MKNNFTCLSDETNSLIGVQCLYKQFNVFLWHFSLVWQVSKNSFFLPVYKIVASICLFLTLYFVLSVTGESIFLSHMALQNGDFGKGKTVKTQIWCFLYEMFYSDVVFYASDDSISITSSKYTISVIFSEIYFF